jgi:L-seryl-tRNA(Ser) seleniumtransferase
VSTADPRRQVPRTDLLLADPALLRAADRLGAGEVKSAVQAVQQLIRGGELAPDQAVPAVLARLPRSASSLSRVLNATGVVLHTNLGRAALSEAAMRAVHTAAGYVDVEYDRETGRRARRGRGALAALMAAVPAAESVLAVNNGAAALVLATTALAAGRELIVSRGELLEIGDGFRLPELVESTGARIREVGTTNRTTVADYAAALGPGTGAVLKVHPSNFWVQGFTSSVEVAELAGLPAPLLVDVGSGLLQPDPLLPDEPDVTSSLAAGAELVTCSGDKLFGGPQAGLIFGRTGTVELLRRHPLARALRIDKLTLAALEATLRGPLTPTARYLHADPSSLRRRCERVAAELTELTELTGLTGLKVEVLPSAGAVGGGGAPGVELVGWAVALPEHFAERLRSAEPAVIGRLEHGRCLLDLRCIEESDEAALIAAVRAAGRAAAQPQPAQSTSGSDSG